MHVRSNAIFACALAFAAAIGSGCSSSPANPAGNVPSDGGGSGVFDGGAEVRTSVPLGSGGVTASEVSVTAPSGIAVRIPAGTQIRLSEGEVPSGNPILTLQESYLAYSDVPAGMESITQLRLGLEVGGMLVGAYFRTSGDGGLGAAELRLPTTLGLQAGERLSLYYREPAASADGGWVLRDLPSRWTRQTQVASNPTGAVVGVGRTGVLLVARSRPATGGVSASGYTLEGFAGKPIATAHLIENGTGEILAVASFSCGGQGPDRLGPKPSGPDDRRYWLWIEENPDATATLFAVSPFANKPDVYLTFCDGTTQNRQPVGPWAWTSGTRGAPVSNPYVSCSVPYDGDLYLTARTVDGRYADLRRDVRDALAQSGRYDAVIQDYCDCASQAGCKCDYRLVTSRCYQDALDHVGGAPFTRTGSGRTASVLYRTVFTVQEMIDLAPDGGEVVVPRGTYEGSIDFKGKALVVRSENPADPATVAATILDGQKLAPVVVFQRGETRASVLRGFTIRNGVATYLNDLELGYVGGGVRIMGASPTIQGNIIGSVDPQLANLAKWGGAGILVTGVSTPLITDNHVVGNLAEDGCGGMLVTLGANPEVTNNTFVNNLGRGAGGVCIDKGATGRVTGNTIESTMDGGVAQVALTVSNSNPWVENNSVRGHETGIMVDLRTGTSPHVKGNRLYANGWGLDLALSSGSPVIEDNDIANNSLGGIIMFCDEAGSSMAVIKNNTVHGNRASQGAGVKLSDWCVGELSGNAITGNIASVSGGGLYLEFEGSISTAPTQGIISANTITGNVAPRCPGMYVPAQHHTQVFGNTVSGNTTPTPVDPPELETCEGGPP